VIMMMWRPQGFLGEYMFGRRAELSDAEQELEDK